MLDTIGRPLQEILRQLDSLHCSHTVTITQPARTRLPIDNECLYVLRQQVGTDGMYHLVAAAKMRQGVS